MNFAELKQAVQEPMTAEYVQEVIDYGLESVAADITETEIVLRHIVVEQNGKPTVQQIGYFQSRGWEVSEHIRIPPRGVKHLRKELGRMERVVRNQLVAGTAEQRAQLSDELEAAKKVAATEGVAIREQIAALQAKLAPIEALPVTLERRLNEVNAAVERLRELVPAELITAESRLRGHAKCNSCAAELESEVAHLERVVGLVPGSTPMIEFCEALTGSHPCKATKGQVDVEAWDAFVSDAQSRLEELKPKLEAARSKLDCELHDAKTLLDFYVQ